MAKRRINKPNAFKFKSYYDEINKEIDKGELRNRKKAVRYVARKLKLQVKRNFGKGNLYEGVGYEDGTIESKVGYKAPAQHAHLVEFGTDERFIRNYKGQPGAIVSAGTMPKIPTLLPVIEQQKDKVTEILSEPWL
jgi:hypothetical protein